MATQDPVKAPSTKTIDALMKIATSIEAKLVREEVIAMRVYTRTARRSRLHAPQQGPSCWQEKRDPKLPRDVCRLEQRHQETSLGNAAKLTGMHLSGSTRRMMRKRSTFSCACMRAL